MNYAERTAIAWKEYQSDLQFFYIPRNAPRRTKSAKMPLSRDRDKCLKYALKNTPSCRDNDLKQGVPAAIIGSK